jgi:hypothetical protein
MWGVCHVCVWGVRFIFANHDGLAVEVETDTSVRVIDLKRMLAASWPSGALTIL